ncbi:diguanylate cyclase [Nitrincola tibetensis]|uniref:diguanylate cyclase n=1 Tax=Nitrincola tibetensis TaxID=2219697 RepID=A0A364NLU4_9GAMM|nr:diguanylate cyclase [Nitrincola tibetensis]RAU18031.1 diguanylate cyclase [Nitrincola tibetensis]
MIKASSNSLTARLETLRIAYNKRLKIDFEELAILVDRLTEDSSNAEYLKKLHSCFHKMAGSAGTFGFQQLGHKVREYEYFLAEALKKPQALQVTFPFADWLEHLRNAALADEKCNSSVGIETNQSYSAIAKPLIWLVERDAILQEYLTHQLQSFGFSVKSFHDALQIENGTEKLPDCILVDHHGSQAETLFSDPVLFWQECFKLVDCPILFMGAEESFTARLNALRSGGQGYFVKPLDMIKLTSFLAQLIKPEKVEPERLLIVEDDQELARHCQSYLEQAGMQVVCLDHPQALFETVSNFNPDLILMDLWLPDVSGAEMASLLRQVDRWAHMPVIYLSAESNVHLRHQALLMGGDAFVEKPLDMEFLVRLCQDRVRRARQLKQTQNQDSLTGLLKHASIKEALQNHWEYVQRQPQVFSVVMLDIDHFKSVNDTYGHAVGDLVIAAVGTLLRQRFRNTDKLGRYGGEEFTLVLIDCTAENAMSMVNALREAFATIQFTVNGQHFSCTLSAGVVDNHLFPDDSPEALLERADNALYKAKHTGRNRVCLAIE